jgi:hypothetical protein
MRLISIYAILIVAGWSAAAAQAPELCLRPELPPQIQPSDDQEMIDLIQEDYQRYFSEIAAYLNCLDREIASAESESLTVIDQWQEHFEDRSR